MDYSDRRGDWIITYTGKRFYPLDPRPEDIDIEDIAHALSLVNRFTGHTRFPYSVAEHSIECSRYVTDGQYLGALLHDAAEAYVNDLARPFKQYLHDYKIVENRILDVIEDKFGVNTRTSQIKTVDARTLVTEASWLCNGEDWWHGKQWPAPLPYSISAHKNWTQVEDLFLERFYHVSPS